MKTQEKEEDETQSGKRLRLSDSESDGETSQPTKKARIVDSDSDDDDRPLSAVATGIMFAVFV